MSKFFSMSVAALSALLSVAAVNAQDLTSTRVNILGRPGVLEMPSAEVAPDGQLSLSYGRFGPVRRTTLTFQIAPRLSGSFRYSGIDGVSEDFDIYWDRSFDVSYLLLNEGKYRPAVSVGLQDFLGTGILSGEYIVATKSVGERLRVTGGLGWGRLGSYNSIASMGERDTSYTATGGTLNFDQWFRGDIAPFGGVSYQLNDKTTLLAEYSSDAYVDEVAAGEIDHKSPLNFGVDYQITKGISLSAFYLYGSEFGFSLTGALNPKSANLRSGEETAPYPVLTRPSRSAAPEKWSTAWVERSEDRGEIREALASAMAKDGMTLQGMSLAATRAEVRFSNKRYGARAQALGRLSRMMSRGLPASIETFVLTETLEGIPVHSTIVSRREVERKEFEPARAILETVDFVDPLSFGPIDVERQPDAFPRKVWSLSPYLAPQFFDPDEPVDLDYGVRGEIYYEAAPGLSFDAAASLSLSGKEADEDDSADDDAALYPVRTSSDKYDDAFQIERLTANWYSRPAENLFSRVTVGYFETMYGGVSGELLWKKPNSRLAFGGELNYAKQRDYDDTFGFLDYDIVTGHVSGYYNFDNGYHGQLDVGRYLAGDWGATLSVDRVFNNGWRVGAYATLTDVPFEDFGEGSFDKGIRVTVPVDWFSGVPDTGTNEIELQSLNRDGGARVDVEGRLYDRVRTLQGSDIQGRWGRFWR